MMKRIQIQVLILGVFVCGSVKAANITGIMGYSPALDYSTENGITVKSGAALPPGEELPPNSGQGDVVYSSKKLGETMIAVRNGNSFSNFIRFVSYGAYSVSMDSKNLVKSTTECRPDSECLTVTPQLCAFVSSAHKEGRDLKAKGHTPPFIEDAFLNLRKNLNKIKECSTVLESLKKPFESFLNSKDGIQHQEAAEESMKLLLDRTKGVGMPKQPQDQLLNLEKHMTSLSDSLAYVSELGRIGERCDEIARNKLLPSGIKDSHNTSTDPATN